MGALLVVLILFSVSLLLNEIFGHRKLTGKRKKKAKKLRKRFDRVYPR